MPNTLSTTRSSHIYTAPGAAMGLVWVPSTVTRMSDDAQRFYTTHIQYINREYVLHTKPETDWKGSDQIRGSIFNIFLQPNKLLACFHFVTDSTCLSDILRFIIHNQHIYVYYVRLQK